MNSALLHVELLARQWGSLQENSASALTVRSEAVS